jgi:hypothetical protein
MRFSDRRVGERGIVAPSVATEPSVLSSGTEEGFNVIGGIGLSTPPSQGRKNSRGSERTPSHNTRRTLFRSNYTSRQLHSARRIQ